MKSVIRAAAGAYTLNMGMWCFLVPAGPLLLAVGGGAGAMSVAEVGAEMAREGAAVQVGVGNVTAADGAHAWPCACVVVCSLLSTVLRWGSTDSGRRGEKLRGGGVGRVRWSRLDVEA